MPSNQHASAQERRAVIETLRAPEGASHEEVESLLLEQLKAVAGSPEAVDEPLVKDTLTRLYLSRMGRAESDSTFLRFSQEISKIMGWYVEKKELKVNSHGLSRQDEKEWLEEVNEMINREED